MSKVIHRYLSLAVVAGLSACQHDLDRTTELKAKEGNQRAKAALAASDFSGARTEYDAVLQIEPTNQEANLGWAVADLLLLPDAQPVGDFLQHCNQPTFNVAQDVFGVQGVLAQAAAAVEGSASVSIHHREHVDESWADLHFEPTRIVSQIESYDGLFATELYVSLSTGRTTVGLLVNVDDALQGDADVTPLASGLEIPIDRLAGSIWVYEDAGDLIDVGGFGSSEVPSGTIRFVEAGTAAGDPIVVELDEVVIPTWCDREGCQRAYRVHGRVEDAVTGQPEIDPSRIPFGTVSSIDGPPRVNADVVAFERCNALEARFAAEKLRGLGDQLAQSSARLNMALSQVGAENIAYLVPRALLHTRQDLTLNQTDFLALKAAVDVASALLDLASRYKTYEGNIQDMIETYCEWDDGSDPIDGEDPVCRDVRKFHPFALYNNLHMNLLSRESDFDTSAFRDRLEQGLAAASAALRNRPAAAGLLDFQISQMATLSNEIADSIDAIRSSISAAAPVALPTVSPVQVHLKTFFDNPIDRERLLMLSGLSSLFVFTPGDSSSPNVWERDDRLELNLEPLTQDPTSILGGLIALPESLGQECGASAPCAGGLQCTADGVCGIPEPRMASSAAWSPLFPSENGGWPLFVSPVLLDAFDF